MAESLGSWIANTILLHDRDFGANLQTPWTGSRYCQLIQFDTYRTPECPHAQITGRISDKTHDVRVTFDVLATDEHDKVTPDVPTETLTSHLRAVFRILSFRFHLLHPPRSTGLEVPRVCLDILEWEVHSGDRNDPVFWDTREVGTSVKDGEVQRVLRKWWFGEATSDPSQPMTSGIEVGQIADTEENRKVSSGANDVRMSLSEFLEPYLHPPVGKKAKPIPDWIFELLPETRQELEDIQVFGLDLARLLTPPQWTALDSTQSSSDTKGKARTLSPSLRPPPAGQATLSPPETMSPVLEKPKTLDHQSYVHPDKDDCESEDDGMPIRPLAKSKRPRNKTFDPLSSSRPSQDSILHPTNEDTDEDELSDYERKRRKSALTSNQEQTTAAGKLEEVKVTVTIQRDDSLAEMESASQSLPETQRSTEDFSLSRYTEAAVPLPQMTVQSSCVLVDDSDPSGAKTTETHTLSQSMPQSGHAPASSESLQRLPTVEKRVEAETSAAAHLDNKLSPQTVTKRTRTSAISLPRSPDTKTYLNLESRASVTKAERFSSPAEEESKRRTSFEERPGSLVRIWTEESGGGNADAQAEQGSVVTEGISAKAEVQSPNAPIKGTSVHRGPHEFQNISNHRPSRSSPIRLVTGRPGARFIDQPLISSGLVDSGPILDKRKLHGFRPDLTLQDGLSEKWVLGMTKVAEDFRRARAARIKSAR